MRLPMLSFVLLAAALLGEIQAASAQSPTSYPWCSRSPTGACNLLLLRVSGSVASASFAGTGAGSDQSTAGSSHPEEEARYRERSPAGRSSSCYCGCRGAPGTIERCVRLRKTPVLAG